MTFSIISSWDRTLCEEGFKSREEAEARIKELDLVEDIDCDVIEED